MSDRRWDMDNVTDPQRQIKHSDNLEILLQIFKFVNCFNTECYVLMNIMFWGKQNLGTLTVSGFLSANINIEE